MNRRELFAGAAAVAIARYLPSQSAPTTFTGLAGRPAEADRHFRSAVIEQAIAEMRTAVGSPELARIFANCFPNTLDTTAFAGSFEGKPDTYVITGDIDAMWLRDSSAQVWPYLAFAQKDAALRQLLEGVIRRQARLILLDSYANAFTRNPSDPPLSWSLHDKTEMHAGVAERKWEIDSLCYPVRLAYGYWKSTGSTAPFDSQWLQAAKRIVATFREQQRISNPGPYSFQRPNSSATDTQTRDGFGSPVKPNGLICSCFRPSDDACRYLFFMPANLFAAVTLERLSEIAAGVYHDPSFARQCAEFARQVRGAINRYGVVHHPVHGEILAYEVDGLGNTLLMDDANAPGLLSLAYLELLPRNSPLYQRTRAFALSADNPYFFRGTAGEGIGGPHVGRDSIIMRGLTSSSEAEITQCLRTLGNSTAGTNFMHEAFYKDDPAKYTRPWFAWANGLFGELLLKLRRERPALLRDFRINA
jgi:hypothetical protein